MSRGESVWPIEPAFLMRIPENVASMAAVILREFAVPIERGRRRTHQRRSKATSSRGSRSLLRAVL
jgi:hypothetical protein